MISWFIFFVQTLVADFFFGLISGLIIGWNNAPRFAPTSCQSHTNLYHARNCLVDGECCVLKIDKCFECMWINRSLKIWPSLITWMIWQKRQLSQSCQIFIDALRIFIHLMVFYYSQHTCRMYTTTVQKNIRKINTFPLQHKSFFIMLWGIIQSNVVKDHVSNPNQWELSSWRSFEEEDIMAE